MSVSKFTLMTVIVLPLALILSCIRTAEKAGGIEAADNLYIQSKFDKAENIYKILLSSDPDNYHILTQLGHIALLSNRLEDAERFLKRAIELDTITDFAASLLAEAYYRQDNFSEAANLFEQLGKEVKARKYGSFGNRIPYQVGTEAARTVLPFVVTDPLPVVQVRINGSTKVNLLIDTGGSELVIDTELAKKVGATLFGDEMGTFAGGKKALYQHGKVDSVGLGEITVRNVPIHIQNVREFSAPIFGDTPIDGIMGTVFLYHFLATLDYPGAQLILQQNSDAHMNALASEETESIAIPFWMAGDHYMVAWGTVNGSKPLLFFVDTGMAGGGFTCPPSTIEEAGITLQKDQADTGMGAGGTVRIIPFVVDELTFGAAREKQIRGLYVENFVLEDAFGFAIGGLISHGFFKHYSLTMDFEHMKYYLIRGKETG